MPAYAKRRHHFGFPPPRVSCQIELSMTASPCSFSYVVMVKGQSSCVRLGPRQIALMTLNGRTLNREATPRSTGASVMRRSRWLTHHPEVAERERGKMNGPPRSFGEAGTSSRCRRISVFRNFAANRSALVATVDRSIVINLARLFFNCRLARESLAFTER